MARLFNHTIAFAQTVLRADTTTDFGKGIRGLRQLVRLLQTAFGSQAQPVGNVVMQRAMRLAIRDTALAATASLLGRLFCRKAAIDLIEIFGPRVSGALCWHFFANVDKLQHLLPSHIRALIQNNFKNADTISLE
jgi:hypothetical protein